MNVIEVSTRLEAGAEAVKTALTINWEGMSLEDIQALAQQALVVKLQGQWRRDKAIPNELTVNVVDHKVGARTPKAPKDVFALVNALSAEEKAALLARLTA